MLALTRYRDEVIMVGDDISIKVTGFKGSLVKLAITAPRETPVYREEQSDADDFDPNNFKRITGQSDIILISRRYGQKINIGHNVSLEIRSVRGTKVTIGVEAPKTLRFTVKRSIYARKLART